MFRTIRWRIAIPYVILILVTMIGLGIYLSSSLRGSYLEEMRERLSIQAHLVADSYQLIAQTDNDLDDINARARQWSDQTGARVTIIGENGVVLADSHENPATLDNHANRPEVVQALETGEGSSTRFSTTRGNQAIYVAVTTRDEAGQTFVVRLSVSLSEAVTNIERMQRILTGATLLVSLFAIMLAVWIASDTTRPVRRLTEVVSQLADGELSSNQIPEQIVPTHPEEIGQLVQAFNLMSDRLRSQISALEIERKKTDAMLREMTDGAVIVDRHGRIQMINRSAEMLFSVQSENALGRTVAEALRHHQVVALWQRCRDSGEAQSQLIELSTNRLYLKAQATSLDPFLQGSILLLFQNLTRQRYLETVRRDFISNLSHELRTPLASLKAITETLQSDALEDPDTARRFLQRMETEVDALTQLVAELLELSRIESGKVPLQFVPTHPRDVVYPAVERLQLQAERARITLDFDCPDALPLVWADPKRMEQVMVNLLHNAIKFTNPGGAITVRVYEDLENEGLHNSVIIAVSDTGIGISSDNLPRIFERFYKTDRARSGSGTGLGLAISKHMVEAHHGRIWAESVEGEGSTFYISIPIHKST